MEQPRSPAHTNGRRWGQESPGATPHHPVVPDIKAHLAQWVGADAAALVFPSADGSGLRRSNFNRRVWHPASRAAGLSGLRFHDLRHTGNTLAASTGASTKELMSRMGHASPRAALMYQHATSERDRVLADALSRLAEPTDWAPPGLHAVPPIEPQCSINVRSGHSCAPEGDPPEEQKVLVKLVETSGLEPPTPCVQSRCSSQLSYVPRAGTSEPLQPRPRLGPRVGDATP